MYFDQIPLKFIPKVPIDNKSALVQEMARRRTGDKPLPEPMMLSSSLMPYFVTRLQWVNSSCVPFILFSLFFFFNCILFLWSRLFWFCSVQKGHILRTHSRPILDQKPALHRLLHSPSLAILGLSAVYETWPLVGWHHPFVIGWYKYRLGLPQSQCILGSCDP